ncbi:hypothetical protein ABID59_002187 [Bradyrhizobium sp. S3.3.6]
MAQLLISREVARVDAEVFIWAELGGIDENAYDCDIALHLACSDKRQMAIVQITHCWHETEALST